MENNEITFEESLKQLETIVEKLENDEIPLDVAVEEFNKAMKLVKFCNKKLNDAEETVAKIVKDNNEIINLNTDES